MAATTLDWPQTNEYLLKVYHGYSHTHDLPKREHAFEVVPRDGRVPITCILFVARKISEAMQRVITLELAVILPTLLANINPKLGRSYRYDNQAVRCNGLAKGSQVALYQLRGEVSEYRK
jgi:hypothetical protein